MQNASSGMNQDCIAAYANTNEQWKCGLVQVNKDHSVYCVITIESAAVQLPVHQVTHIHLQFCF